MKEYYTYILTNAYNRVLYVGVTNNVSRRYFEHATSLHPNGFSARYRLDRLVYVEEFSSINDAIAREKQLKNFSRAKKWQLIKNFNPTMRDLMSDSDADL